MIKLKLALIIAFVLLLNITACQKIDKSKNQGYSINPEQENDALEMENENLKEEINMLEEKVKNSLQEIKELEIKITQLSEESDSKKEKKIECQGAYSISPTMFSFPFDKNNPKDIKGNIQITSTKEKNPIRLNVWGESFEKGEKNFITIEKEQVEIELNQSELVEFTLYIPEDISVGKYKNVIYIGDSCEKEEGETMMLRGQTGITVEIIVSQ